MKNEKASLPDGIIRVDSEQAKLFGLTSDLFSGDSYMWKRGDAIIISLAIPRAKGRFRRLVDRIRELGFQVRIPAPLGEMREMVERCGFTRTIVLVPELQSRIEVWVLDA